MDKRALEAARSRVKARLERQQEALDATKAELELYDRELAGKAPKP